MNNRKKHVLDSAYLLFVEKSFQKTSIADIIERSNISKGTFYNYFSSKNDCVEALLEQIRYETNLMRTEMVVGNDLTDLEVLTDQITALITTNKERGLSVFLDELLHSGDEELSSFVLKYRVQELEWLGDRFEQIFQITSKTKAFEAAVIFYGMQLNMTFVAQLVQPNELDIRSIVKSNLMHITTIITEILKDETTTLQPTRLHDFLQRFHMKEIQEEDVFALIASLLKHRGLTKGQREIVQALKEELERSNVRQIVVEALLKRMIKEFQHSEFSFEVKEVASSVWYFIKKAL